MTKSRSGFRVLATGQKVYWAGSVGKQDDFGNAITDEFVDGRTNMGAWGIMSPASYRIYGTGLGTGYGQKYRRDSQGRWEKVEG